MYPRRNGVDRISRESVLILRWDDNLKSYIVYRSIVIRQRFVYVQISTFTHNPFDRFSQIYHSTSVYNSGDFFKIVSVSSSEVKDARAFRFGAQNRGVLVIILHNTLRADSVVYIFHRSYIKIITCNLCTYSWSRGKLWISDDIWWSNINRDYKHQMEIIRILAFIDHTWSLLYIK